MPTAGLSKNETQMLRYQDYNLWPGVNRKIERSVRPLFESDDIPHIPGTKANMSPMLKNKIKNESPVQMWLKHDESEVHEMMTPPPVSYWDWNQAQSDVTIEEAVKWRSEAKTHISEWRDKLKLAISDNKQ